MTGKISCSVSVGTTYDDLRSRLLERPGSAGLETYSAARGRQKDGR
jgi:hypothetical protein